MALRSAHTSLKALCFVLVLTSCSEQVVVRETEARCGNGTVELGEACDDGNEDSTDACTTACALARCGDGTLRADLEPIDEAYEGCDDGNTSDDDACLTTCVPARCGDGVVRRDRGEGEEAFEACDDGNAMDDDACLNTCVVAFCGDVGSARP